MIKSQIVQWEKWHASWLTNKTTPTDNKQCLDWLLGVGLAPVPLPPASLGATALPDTPPTTSPLDPPAVSERIQEDFQGRKVNRYRTIVALHAETTESAVGGAPVAVETMETD